MSVLGNIIENFPAWLVDDLKGFILIFKKGGERFEFPEGEVDGIDYYSLTLRENFRGLEQGNSRWMK